MSQDNSKIDAGTDLTENFGMESAGTGAIFSAVEPAKTPGAATGLKEGRTLPANGRTYCPEQSSAERGWALGI